MSLHLKSKASWHYRACERILRFYNREIPVSMMTISYYLLVIFCLSILTVTAGAIMTSAIMWRAVYVPLLLINGNIPSREWLFAFYKGPYYQLKQPYCRKVLWTRDSKNRPVFPMGLFVFYLLGGIVFRGMGHGILITKSEVSIAELVCLHVVGFLVIVTSSLLIVYTVLRTAGIWQKIINHIINIKDQRSHLLFIDRN